MNNLANNAFEEDNFEKEAVNEVVNGDSNVAAAESGFGSSEDAAEADAAEAAANPEDVKEETAPKEDGKEKKEPEAPKMPEFTGSAVEKALKKLDWEVANTNPFHDDTDKKEKTPYDQMLQMLLPQVSNALVEEFKKLIEKDEALAERVNLPYKSLKSCWKQTFTALVDAQVKSGAVKLTLENGLSGYAGTGNSDDFCKLMKAYYDIDDKAYLDEQKKKAEEKAKKEAADKKKTEEMKKSAAKKAGTKKPEEKNVEEKKNATLSLFDDFGM